MPTIPINLTLGRWDEPGTRSIVTVHLDSTSAHALTPETIMERIATACTAWRDGYPSGTEAWENASEQFNVGDLADATANPDLAVCLRAVGIERIAVTTHGGDSPEGWDLDSQLMR